MLSRVIKPAEDLVHRISEIELVQRLAAHRATTHASSISYYALLSLFPAVIALTAVTALIADDPSVRTDVVDFLFEELPVNETNGRGDIQKLVNGAADNAGTIGIIGFGFLIFSASALMSAMRNALTIAFEVENPRPYLKAKAFDVLLVLVLGLLIGVSVAGTLLINLLDEAKDDLGVFGDALGGVLGFLAGLLPILLSGVVFAILLTFVPGHGHRLRQVWPAIAMATAGFELAKRGFSLYLDEFSHYAALYGSLGAVIAFLVFVYLSALVLLASSELAAMRAARTSVQGPAPD